MTYTEGWFLGKTIEGTVISVLCGTVQVRMGESVETIEFTENAYWDGEASPKPGDKVLLTFDRNGVLVSAEPKGDKKPTRTH